MPRRIDARELRQRSTRGAHASQAESTFAGSRPDDQFVGRYPVEPAIIGDVGQRYRRATVERHLHELAAALDEGDPLAVGGKDRRSGELGARYDARLEIVQAMHIEADVSRRRPAAEDHGVPVRRERPGSIRRDAARGQFEVHGEVVVDRAGAVCEPACGNADAEQERGGRQHARISCTPAATALATVLRRPRGEREGRVRQRGRKIVRAAESVGRQLGQRLGHRVRDIERHARPQRAQRLRLCRHQLGNDRLRARP